jgi:hypothetical protein
MKRAKKLLFVGACGVYFRPFMQWDLDLLKGEYDVRLVEVCYGKHMFKRTLVSHLRLISGVAWADVVFCWFANYEAFAAIALSQLLNKKTAVAVGGQDVTTIPELEYGLALHSRPFLSLVRFDSSFKNIRFQEIQKGGFTLLKETTTVANLRRCLGRF